MKISPALSPSTAGVHPGRPSLLHQSTDRAIQILEREISSHRTPGVQYRHFSSDSLLLRFDGGLANLHSRAPVTESTTFQGYSVTKTVTAVAILQLMDRGKIELDQPAADLLPRFQFDHAITVRQLLTHSAGLGNPLPLRWTHLPSERPHFQGEAFFREIMARHGKAKSMPNARMQYSNLGYVVLGWIIEAVSGMSYERYVTERVLIPLTLGSEELGFEIHPAVHATGYHPRFSCSRMLLPLLMDTPKYMLPSEGRWQGFRPNYVNGAAYGGLVGTADGFMRYVQALLDPRGGLLSERSRGLLWTENVLNNGRASGMALSWFTGELEGHPTRTHPGGGGGFYAEIRLYPEVGRGSVVLFNRSGFSYKRFLDKVDRHLLQGR